MRRINLKYKMSDEEAEKLLGKKLDEDSYDYLVSEDCKVYRPDGKLLAVYRKDIIPLDVCRAAHKNLRDAATSSNNRGISAGEIDESKIKKEVGTKSKFRFKALLKDGRLSRTTHANPVNSGIIGYFDRYPRIPYCRLTAFNLKNPKRFARSLPFIKAVNQVFKENVPDRYKVQAELIGKTSKDFFIKDTAFTTLTVNRNWQTAVHQDIGDLKEGFGVMSALRKGHYEGCYLVFPQFRVAFDMQTGGVLLADVHQYHGNTPFKGKAGRYERVSCVFYYREKMKDCGSAKEELERAKVFGKGKLEFEE